MTARESTSAADAPPLARLVATRPLVAAAVLAVSLAGWASLTWLSVAMDHPVAQLMMPGSSDWSAANTAAMLAMWAVMMAAMMLPAALPMILTFIHLGARGAEAARGWAFTAAYLCVWAIFSLVAVAMQWMLQAAGWVDPMIVSASPLLTGSLLAIAGIYQFTPLKRVCLSRCRTPLGFLIGDWRPGIGGAFRMGLRHGLFCTGCCWALMALLFVGGVMNLAWVAALSIVVAIEKTAPHGETLGRWLGAALILAGLWKIAVQVSG